MEASKAEEISELSNMMQEQEEKMQGQEEQSKDEVAALNATLTELQSKYEES